MIRIAICDDNRLQLSMAEAMVKDYINEHAFCCEISCFEGGEELLKAAESLTFNIFILDMLMPGKNGMEVARELRRRRDDGQIIFLTADPSYGVESYQVDTAYYLVKPLGREELDAALGRTMQRIPEKNLDFRLKTPKGYALIRHKELMFAEAVDRSPVFHLTRGREITGLVLRNSFTNFTKGILAGNNFAYLGPSKLINLRYVDKMDDESVLLTDGTLIYGSRAGCSAFRISWEEFIMSNAARA